MTNEPTLTNRKQIRPSRRLGRKEVELKKAWNTNSERKNGMSKDSWKEIL